MKTRLWSPVLLATLLSLVAAPALSQQASFGKKTYVYKTVGTIDIEADVYRADNDDVQPVLMWIHGGALIVGSRVWGNRPLMELCEAEGCTFVSIDYRLAPEAKLPEIAQDLEDAVAWIREKGPELFHADPVRLVVAGASAGGYLTMLSGIRVDPKPTALISFWGYGAADAPFDVTPSEFYRTTQPLLTREEAYQGVGDAILTNTDQASQNRFQFYLYLRQNGLWADAVMGLDPATQRHQFDPYAPNRNVKPDYPPILMVHGTNDTDVPYEESVNMAVQLQPHGVRHEVILVPGGGHGIGNAEPELVADANTRVATFVREHLFEGPRSDVRSGLRMRGQRLADEEQQRVLQFMLQLSEGERLARAGQIQRAIAKYVARGIDTLALSTPTWNTLCRQGVFHGRAADVLKACDESVRLAPNLWWARESRGIARALTGDLEGALADLEPFVDRMRNERTRVERQRWVDALRVGENPFTPEVLARLRGL